MQIIEIKGTGIDLTGAIKQYVEKKLAAVAKLVEGIEPADVAADVGRESAHHNKGDVFHAEFNLTLPNTLIRATAKKDDLYAAIDVAASELRRQVKDYKEKLRDASRVRMESEVVEHEWEE